MLPPGKPPPWGPKDVVAAILAIGFILFGLLAMAIRAFGPGPLPGLTEFKEIMMVLIGGLIMWIGGGKPPR